MTVNGLASVVASCFRVSFPIRSGPSVFFDLREMSISVTCFSQQKILLNVFGPKSTFVLFVFTLKTLWKYWLNRFALPSSFSATLFCKCILCGYSGAFLMDLR